MGIEATADGFAWTGGGAAPAVAAFHAVRRMAYASTGSRDPADLVRTGRGACTAKHGLLTQLLRSVGVDCRMQIVAGRFGAGLPESPGMPPELCGMIRDGGVPDYHNVVTAQLGGEAVLLDATWPDAFIRLGFPVNDDWHGQGSTRPAVIGPIIEPDAADPTARKAALVAALPPDDQRRRLRFLALLSDYSLSLQ